MGSKRNIKTRNCLAAFLIVLATVGLVSCSNYDEGRISKADPLLNLLNQTYFFEKAPEKLFFGTAVTDSASDQGAEINYLSAFHDGEATYIFFTVTDTGAGLFSKGCNGCDLSLDQYDFLEKTGYNDSRQYDLISYDEDALTATFCVEYIGPLQTEELSFHIYSMTGNQKKINMEFGDVDLYQILNNSAGEFEPESEYTGNGTGFGIYDEKTGQTRTVEMPAFEEGNGDTIYRLKKDAMSFSVEDAEGNHAADITNIGWRNGWLHIQVNPLNSIAWETNFNLKRNNTGELIYSPFNFCFGPVQDGREPNDYYEYVFYVGDLEAENLDCTITFQNEDYRAASLQGDWEIKLSIPDSLVKRLAAEKAVLVGAQELILRRAVISPVNITLFASAKDFPEEDTPTLHRIRPEALDLKILYHDGSSVEIPKNSGRALGNQKGNMFRFIYTAENFDDIAGLEINGVLFSVEEGR